MNNSAKGVTLVMTQFQKYLLRRGLQLKGSYQLLILCLVDVSYKVPTTLDFK